MKKKVPEKLKALVIDSVRRHAWNIGVSHYTGDILYMDEDKGGERDGYVYADMTTDRRYLKATLKIGSFHETAKVVNSLQQFPLSLQAQ